MQGIDFTEVLTGQGFKNLILAHVELLTSVDPNELPKGFSWSTARSASLALQARYPSRISSLSYFNSSKAIPTGAAH
jgi:hypothetical protein